MQRHHAVREHQVCGILAEACFAPDTTAHQMLFVPFSEHRDVDMVEMVGGDAAAVGH